MAEYRMLPNIRAHSLLVARIAELLATALRQGGMTIEVGLALAAALMHDIGKSLCLENDRAHAPMGEEICLRHGFDELAPLVAQHVVLGKDAFPWGPLSAREVVYYADKRVKHDRIVPLAARFDYILERYGQNDPARQASIRENFGRCQAIEEEIFQRLDFGPDELQARLDTSALAPWWLAADLNRDSVACRAEGCR